MKLQKLVILTLGMVWLVGVWPANASASPPSGFAAAYIAQYQYSRFQEELKQSLEFLEKDQFQTCDPKNSPSDYRPIYFVIPDYDLNSRELRLFLDTLQNEKEFLMALYGLSNDRYNILAQMAVGILGNESKFFKAPMYFVKSTLPDQVIYLVKDFDNIVQGRPGSAETLSKGPTAIKEIPGLIAHHYDLKDKEQLENPFYAAVATLGYLAEAYNELTYKVAHYNMTCVNDENFYDMLLYLYFGGSSYRRDLINCRVNPNQNIYIKNHRVNKTLILMFEKP